jgi:ankyrin repeat protein
MRVRSTAPRRIIRGFFASALGALMLSAVLHASTEAIAVVDAAMRGDRDSVRSLLKDGADVNSAQGDGMTALHWAATKGDVNLAEMLLYAGANVKATTRLGAYTPLTLAAKSGDSAMIAALIKAGADVKTATSTGVTPLMLAAASGNGEAVKVLLEKGADIDAREQSMQQTALMFAAAANRIDAINVLVGKGANVKASTKVVDLFAFSRELEAEFRRFQQQGGPGPAQQGQNPQGPNQQGQGPQGQGQQAEEQRPASTAGSQPAGQAAAAAPAAQGAGASRNPGGQGQQRRPQVPGVDRQYLYNELVGHTGGLAPIHFAARQGHLESVKTLLAAGADVNQLTGDKSSPLLIAVVNGHFDVAEFLIGKGADVTLASENGATPLYAVLNVQWAPKALYPQPRAYLQQELGYLDLMKLLIEKGADPNARLVRKVWYSGYNFDLSGVDEIGATPFWRAAYASDVDAMKLLVAHGADPNLRTIKPAGRPRTGDGGRESTKDVSGIPPVPVGGPGVTPLQAAAGVGYGEGFAANSHRFAPIGMMEAVKYLIEELGADVNAVDHEGNAALHHAAARGDNEMILYLVSKGANVKAVNREGNNIADMANGPVQRIEPFPQTLALLEKMGVKHQNKCVSC